MLDILWNCAKPNKEWESGKKTQNTASWLVETLNPSIQSLAKILEWLIESDVCRLKDILNPRTIEVFIDALIWRWWWRTTTLTDEERYDLLDWLFWPSQPRKEKIEDPKTIGPNNTLGDESIKKLAESINKLTSDELYDLANKFWETTTHKLLCILRWRLSTPLACQRWGGLISPEEMQDLLNWIERDFK